MYPLHINDVFSDIFVFAILCKLKTTWHDQFLSSLKSMKPDDYFFCFFYLETNILFTTLCSSHYDKISICSIYLDESGSSKNFKTQCQGEKLLHIFCWGEWNGAD